MSIEKQLIEIVKQAQQPLIQEIKTLKERLEQSEVIQFEQSRYISKKTASQLLDCTESTISKYILNGDLTKRFLNGTMTVRLLESEVLALVKDKMTKEIAVIAPTQRVKRGMRFKK